MVGSATALNILFGVELWVGALVTIINSFLFLFIHYFGVRKLEVFFAFLIATMATCFLVNMFASKPDYGQMVVGSLVPYVPAGAWSACLGLIGAVIMPHNLYLHSSLVLSREINTKNRYQVREATIYNAIESALSLLISAVISTAVITTFANYRDKAGEVADVDLLKAAAALESTFGPAAKYIWGVGLLAAGQSSTMTGTYAGQFVMEGFLDIKLPIWQRVMITRAVAIAPALVVVFLSAHTLTDLDNWLNILQSVQLPFALIPTLKFCSSKQIMGEFAMSRRSLIFGGTFGFCLFLMNFVIIFMENNINSVGGYVIAIVFIILYLGAIYLAISEPVVPLKPLTAEDGEEDFAKLKVEGFDDEREYAPFENN